MLTLQRVDDAQLPMLRSLYWSAFPRSERKPLAWMQRRAHEQKMELLTLSEHGVFTGLVITMLHKDMVLVDYFAISPRLRGGGIGTRALAALREYYPNKRLFLEIEAPDDAAENAVDRRRRKDFYLKNGFWPTGIFVALFGIRMELLSQNCTVTFSEYQSVYANCMGESFTKQSVLEVIV